MKIALVTVRPPFPPDSGNRIRTFQLLRQLGAAHQVTLITAAESNDEVNAAAALAAQIPRLSARIVRVPLRNNGLRRLIRAAANSLDPRPYTWAAFQHPRFRQHVSTSLAKEGFDLVHCDNIQIADLVIGSQRCVTLLTALNVDSILLGRMAAVQRRPIMRKLLSWQAAKVSRRERHVYAAFDACISMSDLDREHIARIAPKLRIWTVPNGVDLDHFQPAPDRVDPRLLVFCGAMDWPPNADAAAYFAREVLPRIRRRLPSAVFLVVGRNPTRQLVRMLSSYDVQVTGSVTDVRPFLARAGLVVVPLRAGGGTRLKIPEAWAMEKPVLSTCIGAEGLPVVDGENIALADSPNDLAEKALSLLENPAAAARIGAAGRQLAEDQFSWKKIGARLLAAYDATIAAGKSAHPASRRP